MTKILGFIFGDMATGWILKAIYISIVVLIYGLVIASITFVIGALMTTYTLTTDVLSLIESYNSSASSSTSSIMSSFFQLLSCIGIIDAINATKLMFFSAVSFLLLRLLYLQIMSAVLTLLRIVTPLLTR